MKYERQTRMKIANSCFKTFIKFIITYFQTETQINSHEFVQIVFIFVGQTFYAPRLCYVSWNKKEFSVLSVRAGTKKDKKESQMQLCYAQRNKLQCRKLIIFFGWQIQLLPSCNIFQRQRHFWADSGARRPSFMFFFWSKNSEAIGDFV